MPVPRGSTTNATTASSPSRIVRAVVARSLVGERCAAFAHRHLLQPWADGARELEEPEAERVAASAARTTRRSSVSGPRTR